MKKNKILLVEDHEVLAKNIRKILESSDFNVIKVIRKGEDVLKELDTLKPSALIMDIFLAGKLDGIQTAALIEKRWNIPIIFLTSNSEKEIVNRAKKTGAYSYVTKDEHLKEQLPILIEFAIFKHEAIQDKQKAWLKLSESEDKFKSIASSAKDAIIFVDNDGSISYWNKSASKMFGYTSKEAGNLKFYNLIDQNDLPVLINEGIFNPSGIISSKNFSVTLDLKANRQSGETFSIELSMSGLRLNGKDCACGIIRDTTVRNLYETELRNLVEELHHSQSLIERSAAELSIVNEKLAKSEIKLKELNASKDKFFSIIAHDIKNPFQGLLGYSGILAKNYQNLDIKEIGDISEIIDSSATQIFKLFENLLLWSSIQRGALNYNPTIENLAQITDLVISLLKLNADMKGIKIETEISNDISVFTDLNILNTVIRNLISNSIKFTKKDGKIRVSAKERGNEIVYSVNDNGVGISKEKIGKLFQLGENISTSGTSEEKGTGLGLLLCKDLIEKNHGKIWVESIVGKGTSFYFTIPMKKF